MALERPPQQRAPAETGALVSPAAFPIVGSPGAFHSLTRCGGRGWPRGCRARSG